MNRRDIAKGAAFAGGAIAGIASAAWATQKLAAERVRRMPDGDAARALDAPIYVDQVIDTHDRGTIYVVESGEGPTIVLSHGVTLSVRTWFHQLELLPKDGFRVIAYDHRGHGQSVLGEAGHSLENLAEDINTVLTRLDIHDAVFVGHSMGGVAVQAFIDKYPDVAKERLRGIVLLSTISRAPLGSRSTRTKARLERVFKQVPDTTPLWKSRNLGFMLARLGFGTDPQPSHVELVRQMMQTCASETRLQAPRVLVGLDLDDELARITIPTLVIGGLADVITPPGEARKMAKLIPNARLELLEGGGHLLMLERAEEVNKLIADFAREVGLAP